MGFKEYAEKIAVKKFDEAKYDKAIDWYNKIIEIEPDCAAYNNRGLAYSRLNKDTEAIQDYNRSIALSPKSGMTYINRAISYYSLKQWDKALEDCNQGIKHDNRDALAYKVRGQVYLELKNFKEALKDFNRSLEIDYKQGECYYLRGYTYSFLDTPNKALVDLDQAIKYGYEEPHVYYRQGIVCMTLGILDKALENFNRNIQSGYYKSDCYYASGLIFRKQGNLDAAMVNFSKSIEINHLSKCFYRGVINMAQGKMTDALLDFDKAIEQDSTKEFAYLHRGIVNYDLGKEQAARTDLSQLHTGIILHPQRVPYYINTRGFNLGNTGLHIAVTGQDEKLADILLKSNIDQSIKNREGLTAIEIACQAGSGKMVALLVNDRKQKETKPVTNAWYESALIMAVRNEHYANVAELLSVNTSCDLFDPDEKGNLVVYEALAKDNVRILGLLLTRLDSNHIACIKNGDSIFEIAHKMGAYSCSRYLLQRDMLAEIKKELPQFSWFYSLPPGLNDIDRELRSLQLQESEQVNAAFFSIQALLYKKPAGIGGDMNAFYERFQKKSAAISGHLHNLPNPAQNTIYTGQSYQPNIFSLATSGLNWHTAQQPSPQEYVIPTITGYFPGYIPPPVLASNSEPVYHNGQKQTFFQMALSANKQQPDMNFTAAAPR